MQVEAIRDTTHGDWKTCLARNEWPGLKKGERGKLVKEWSNFYGRWYSVRLPNGQLVDLSPHDLQKVEP